MPRYFGAKLVDGIRDNKKNTKKSKKIKKINKKIVYQSKVDFE